MFNSYYAGNPAPMMGQMYPGAQQQPMGRSYAQPLQRLKCYPVTSYDEVKSAMVDFDGSVTVYPDLVHGRIYTKGANNDGTAFINVYTLAQTPVEVDPIEARIQELERAIEELRGGLNDEQHAELSADTGDAAADSAAAAAITGSTKSNGSAAGNKRK